MADQGATAPHRPRLIEHSGETRPTEIARRRKWGVPRSAVLLGVLLGVAMSVYLFAPLRTNVLVLGLDRAPQGTAVARTDTIILTTCVPSRPYAGALSIPRDLWLTLPDGSANRINTAHYFAEAAAAGSGPTAIKETVELNFGVDVHYTLRLRFATLVELVDLLGGVEVHLQEATALYPAGSHLLDGEQALAFARDREASDDFGRMARGQLLLRSLLRRSLNPTVWPRLPSAALLVWRGVDSEIPLWQWPRLAVCALRVGPDRLDGRVLDRSTVRGLTTTSGAQVLEPLWPRINPILLEMFGQ